MLSTSQLAQWKQEYLEKNHCRQSQEQTTLAYPYSSAYSLNNRTVSLQFICWKQSIINYVHKSFIV